MPRIPIQAFYSSQERSNNVESGQERNVFVSWREALNYLGGAAWEALHVDADGIWYFKRRSTDGETGEPC